MNKNFKTGFTLIEVLLIFTVMSVILAASIPLISGKSVPVPLRFQQGAYYCIADNNLPEGKFIEAYYTKRRLVSEDYVDKCKFNPPQRATVYRVEVIGAGAGGNGFINVSNPEENINAVYDMSEGYVFPNSVEDSKKLFYELTDTELWNMFKGVYLTKSSFAQGANRGGNIYYRPNTDRCTCKQKTNNGTVSKFSCRYFYDASSKTYEKKCFNGGQINTDTLDPNIEKKALRNKSGKYISAQCKNLGSNCVYECEPREGSWGVSYWTSFGGTYGNAGYIIGTVQLPDIRSAEIKAQGINIPNLLKSYADRMKSGHCKEGTGGKNQRACNFVNQQLEGKMGSQLYDKDDDVGEVELGPMYGGLYEWVKSTYDPDKFDFMCKKDSVKGLSVAGYTGTLCYAKRGYQPTELAAVQTPRSQNGVALLNTTATSTIIQQGLATSGGPAGLWASNEQHIIADPSNTSNSLPYVSFDGYNFSTGGTFSYEGGKVNIENIANALRTYNKATDGTDAYMEKDGAGNPITLPQESRDIIPQLDIAINLTYRRYEIGNPGGPGELKVYTVGSLEGPCTITVKRGGKAHYNNPNEDISAPETPNDLASKMVCKDHSFEALGGKFSDTVVKENHFNINEYKSYTDKNGSNYGKAFSFKPDEYNRLGGLISDFNTVFYRHIKELIDGKKEKKAENLITNLGKGGDGAKFEDKCVKRFRGTYRVTVNAGDESNLYSGRNVNKTLEPSCLPDNELGADVNRYYGTKSKGVNYDYTNATDGYGGAVIVTW